DVPVRLSGGGAVRRLAADLLQRAGVQRPGRDPGAGGALQHDRRVERRRLVPRVQRADRAGHAELGQQLHLRLRARVHVRPVLRRRGDAGLPGRAEHRRALKRRWKKGGVRRYVESAYPDTRGETRMTGEPPPPGSRIDTSTPHAARMWNYWLGGKDYYDVDRVAGDQFSAAFPDIVHNARLSRHLIARIVRYMVNEAGVRQFLDVGTGLPTVDNTHEVAQRADPTCRVVYVDNDPLVLTHARALLVGTPEGATDYIEADLREPETIIAAAAKTLDLTQPVTLMLMGIVGFISDEDDAHGIVARLMDALPSGSYLALWDGVNVVTGDSLDQAQDDY